MQPSDLFGPASRPRFYRTKRGRFRRQTRKEYRALFTDEQWAMQRQRTKHWKKIARHIAHTDPWASLFARKEFP